MLDDGSSTDLNRRSFLKAAAGALGMRVMGVFLPPGAVIISGCTRQRTPEELARRMIIAIDERVQTLDPCYQIMALDSYIICNIYDTLTWFNRDLEHIPRLALSWESPDDGSSWIFNLRPGIKFHDGTPCDANAVKYHFDRIKDPANESKRRTKLGKMNAVEVVDPLTVRFEMSEPYSTWPVVLRDSFAGIVSPTAVETHGTKQFTNHPVGTGRFMVAEQSQGERVVLKRNPHHWEADKITIDEVEFRTVREPTTRLILLEQDTIDLCSVTFAHTDVAEESGKVKISQAPMLAVRYVGFNCMKPPFDDPRVRRACNMAVNRHELVKFGFRGNADPLVGPLPSVMPDFNDEMPLWEYDLEKAKALLAEAGYPDGVNVTLWTKDDVTDTNLGVVVADQLGRIGIRVEIIRYDRNVYWEKFKAYQTLNMEWYPTKEGVFDMYAAGWVGGEHPHGYLDPLFNSKSSSNASFYKNPEVDSLISQSLKTVDVEARSEIYKKLQATIVHDAPWIFAYSSRVLYGINPRISGLNVHPAGDYEFHGVQLGGGDGQV